MIYIVLVLVYILLGISLLTKQRTLGMIASFGIMTTGVYILINGISYMDNLMTQAVATISIGLGFYMLVAATFETMKESEI